MKKYSGIVLLAFAPYVSAIQTQSQTFSITESNSVGFFNFNLLQSQAVDIFTQGPSNDPEIFLFSGNTPLAGNSIASDDDSCPDAFCGVAGSARNSLIANFLLDSGDYTVAVSDFSFSESEAAAGVNSFVDPGDITVTVRDAGPIDGFLFVPVIPDPAPMQQLIEDIAQIEQEQEQSENTNRVISSVVGNHVGDVISNVFGFSPSGTGAPSENNAAAASADTDNHSSFLPDAFWGKHVYTSLSEDSNNLGYTTDLYQFIGGLDKRVGNLFMGSALTYIYGETNQAGNNSSTHSIGITPYAAYKINDFLFVSGLASYVYTGVNGTQGRRDADVHNYSGEITLNAFKKVENFLLKGRAGLRYTHNYTSLKGTFDADYDQLTWISDVEFGYNINSNVQVFTGILYEYIDKESTVGTSRLAISPAVHDGVIYFRGGLNYKVNEKMSLGIDASSDLNDEDNDILSFGANIRIEI